MLRKLRISLKHEGRLNIFDQIMDKSVVFRMEREVIQNNWNPIENSDVLINLLILWRKDNLMSDYHFNSLVDDQIVPKLMHTLESSYNSSRICRQFFECRK